MKDDARKVEFERLKRQWWWLDRRRQTHANTPAAWNWEILRRTEAYQRFHKKASAIARPLPPEQLAPGAPLQRALGAFANYHEHIRRIASETATLGDLDPARTWAELFLDGCDPALSWIELPSVKIKHPVPDCLRLRWRSSRTRSADRNRIVPRQDKPVSQYPFHVASVVLERDATGREAASSLARRKGRLKEVPAGQTPGPAVMYKHPMISVLPSTFTRLGYLVIMFDTRAGESVCDQLRAWKQRVDQENDNFDGYPVEELRWLADAQDSHSTSDISLKRCCRVVPSRLQNQAQVWIPAKLYHDIEKIFRTMLTPRERQKWLPCCCEAWALPEQITLFGQPRTVRYAPYSDTPAALKAKSGQLKLDTLKVGLAALDCRPIEPKFTQAGLLIPFLKSNKAESDPEIVREAMKMVQRRIAAIDSHYPAS